jgi:hypothetical protein
MQALQDFVLFPLTGQLTKEDTLIYEKMRVLSREILPKRVYWTKGTLNYIQLRGVRI